MEIQFTSENYFLQEYKEISKKDVLVFSVRQELQLLERGEEASMKKPKIKKRSKRTCLRSRLKGDLKVK